MFSGQIRVNCANVLSFSPSFQITPSAKKLWGVEDGQVKEEGNKAAMFNIDAGQPWRTETSNTWSTGGGGGHPTGDSKSHTKPLYCHATTLTAECFGRK